MRPVIFLIVLGMACGSLQALPSDSAVPSKMGQTTEYQSKDYTYLLGMPGFTDLALKMHFTLYQNYVKNANQLQAMLREMGLTDKTMSIEYGALKRRFNWEFDGMRLHELYFDNLGGKVPMDKSSALYQQIMKDFGSFPQWKKEFISTGSIRGIGWAILYRDPQNGHLINVWVEEHDIGHLAGGQPLLVMDVFEHAYMPQFGLDKAKYIDTFFENINWPEVMKRYDLSAKR
jgi:Fe-Mn family superoxide dismutase